MSKKAKLNGEKIALVLKAWEDLREAKSFAGMTLEEFTAKLIQSGLIPASAAATRWRS